MARQPSKTVKEEIDIGKEASELGTSDNGSLEQLDQKEKIKHHWWKERAIVLLSISVIGAILVAGLLTLGWSEDEPSRDWARQSLTALLGFAAGALFTKTTNDNSRGDS